MGDFCVTPEICGSLNPNIWSRRRGLLHRSAHDRVRRPSTGWGDTNVAEDDRRWQDMNPDEQAVVIRQINGTVNGLQFRVQDLEDAVKALQERLKR